MHHFDYKNGALHAEDVAITALADKIGTPFYCYSASTIRRHIQVFFQAFSGLDILVCYAIKAKSNQAVLRLLADEGAGSAFHNQAHPRHALFMAAFDAIHAYENGGAK